MYESGFVYGWMMTGNWTVIQLLLFVVIAAVFVYSIGSILKKLGYPPLWSMLAFVPGLNLIGQWIVALGLGGPEVRLSRSVDRIGGA